MAGLIRNNASFGAYSYSAGSEYGNLHQSSVTTSRLTRSTVISGPTKELVFAKHKARKNGKRSSKNEAEWTGKVDIRNGEIPGSRQSMHAYTKAYVRLYRENL